VDFTGDNFLAEFPTALDAVECAVDVQRVLAARNASLREERRMQFRIGVHMGDVTTEGDRIYGDGVNIAARLEGLADPGGVCISATVHEQVERKLDFGFEDLGDQTVKNIPKPVRAYRVRLESAAPIPEPQARARPRALFVAGVVVILVVAGLLVWRLIAPSDDQFTVPGFGDAPAIAVLPFDNLSGDPEQEYFADGIAEDVITRLSSGLFPVIARNSSFTYKRQEVKVQQVGRELGARYVIEGSVRRTGDRVRISAQLIDATSGHHVWAETYDRDLEDLFAIQDEITQAIAWSVGNRLSRAESESAVRWNPRSLDAYDLYMRGQWHGSKGTAEGNAKARSLYEQAIEIDPSYAPVFSALAFAHYASILRQWSDSPDRSLDGLERAARTCVALDPQYAGCQLSMGQLASLTGRRDEMFAGFEAAVRTAPSNVWALFTLGVYAAPAGRPEEGLAHIEKAIRLSPKDPALGVYFYGVALAHLAAGRYGDAVDWAQRSLTLIPEFEFSHLALVVGNVHLGRSAEASAALEGLLRVRPGFSSESISRAYSTADPEFVAFLVEGVRIAGLPEG
jgi:adenylate cyclase